MYRWTNHVSYGLIFAASLTLGATGCSKSAPPPAASQPVPAADTHTQHDHADHTGHQDQGAADEADAFASLSPEDRAAAEKQRVCPVTGEPLGTMGPPIKVTVKDRVVFLCCEGCRDSLMKDPDKYLAKLAN